MTDKVREYHLFAELVESFRAASGGRAELGGLAIAIAKAGDAGAIEWLKKALVSGTDMQAQWMLRCVQIAVYMAARCDIVDGWVLMHAGEDSS